MKVSIINNSAYLDMVYASGIVQLAVCVFHVKKIDKFGCSAPLK